MNLKINRKICGKIRLNYFFTHFFGKRKKVEEKDYILIASLMSFPVMVFLPVWRANSTASLLSFSP